MAFISVEQELARKLQRYEKQLLGLPITKKLICGQATVEDYKLYLLSAYYYVSHTALKLEEAGKHARETLPRLANYYFKHAEEERGHENIILEDLQALGVKKEKVPEEAERKAVLGARAMVGCGYYLSHYHAPVAFLGEILVIEGLSQKRAFYFSKLIERSLKMKVKATRFLDSHGQLDQGHVQELKEMIHAFVRTKKDKDDVRTAIDLIYPLYIQMLSEITGNVVVSNGNAFDLRRFFPRKEATC